MIAITGGAGAMGGRIVRLLVRRGIAVRVVDLDRPGTGERLESLGADFHPANIADPSSLRGAFDGADAVLHLAALLLARGETRRLAEINTEGTANVIAEARSAGVRRLVHVSSISVTYKRQNPYSRSKLDAERHVRASGLDWTILRPTLAWGDPLAAEYGRFRAAVLALPVLPLPGGGAARKRPVHVDDLAEAFASCLSTPATIGRTLALSGPEETTLAGMARRIRSAHGHRGVSLPLPVSVCGAAANALERVCAALGIAPAFDWQTFTGLVEDAAPDNADAATALAWTPRPWRPEP